MPSALPSTKTLASRGVAPSSSATEMDLPADIRKRPTRGTCSRNASPSICQFGPVVEAPASSIGNGANCTVTSGSSAGMAGMAPGNSVSEATESPLIL